MTMDGNPPPEEIRTVRDAVRQICLEEGDENFLHYRDRRLSYHQVDRQSNRIANELRNQGVEAGDHVCLFLYNSVEYLYLYFALAKLGAVAVPIDTRYAGNTLAEIITHSDASMIFIDERTLADYQDVRGAVQRPIIEYFVGEVPGDHTYREFDALLDGADESLPDASVEEDDPFSITYVQQSPSERPKGVVLPHFSYVNTGWESGHNLFDISTDDRLLTTLPLHSIFTAQVGVMTALMTRAEFVLEDRFEPELFWDRIESHDATAFLYLSRMLSVLTNQDPEPSGTTPAELAIGHSFGFVTDKDLFENFEDRFDVTVLEGYGITQSGSIATYNTTSNRKVSSVGNPISYADIWIVDENDRRVPTGEIGEIVIRSNRPNTMFTRYYRAPERTIEDCRNQWIHSGDFGYVDEDGYLYFTTSRANSIYRDRIAGRISSLEIETVINSLPGVRTSAVVGVENPAGEKDIKAIVVPEVDASVDPVAVCTRCQQQLPYLKIPRFIEIREELPRSSTGKVERQTLRDEGIDGVWDRKAGYGLSR